MSTRENLAQLSHDPAQRCAVEVYSQSILTLSKGLGPTSAPGGYQCWSPACGDVQAGREQRRRLSHPDAPTLRESQYPIRGHTRHPPGTTDKSRVVSLRLLRKEKRWCKDARDIISQNVSSVHCDTCGKCHIGPRLRVKSWFNQLSNTTATHQEAR